MRFGRIIALAIVLTLCVAPAAADTRTAVADASPTALAQDGMNDTTTDGSMDDETTDDGMTDDGMENGTTDGEMTDDETTDGMEGDTMNDRDADDSITSLPGFGIVVALVALLGGALYVARTR